jgi:predicted MFS family arabinose efflux permease
MTALSLPFTNRTELSSKAAFALLSSTLVALLASSSAPTPLYAAYQAEWGFSDVTITVIFGVYAVAVLASLLVFGSLSDHVGRRPVLITALSAQALVMLLFAWAGDLDALLLARVLQGLATGAALGAIGAGLVDLHPARGAIANAASAMAGTASGALGAGLLVQLLPAPTKLVYLVLSVVFLSQVAGVLKIDETSPRKPGAAAALKPTLAIPERARGALLIATPSLVAVWALGGFYASLGPSVAGLIAGSGSVLLGGAALFTLAGSGSLTVVAFHRVEPRKFALAGNALIILGVAVVLWAISLRSTPVFFVGTAFAGSGFGAGFQGGLRTVVPLVDADERGGILSVAYLICYLAMGLPAILAGFLVVHGTLLNTTREFGVGVIVLAATTAVALLIAARRSLRREQSSRTANQAAAVCQTA